MGLCISRPEIDDVDEQTALLRASDAHQASQATPGIPDRFANKSPEEIAQLQENERLQALQKRTTEALINISHHSELLHGQTFNSGGQHGYEDVLREFNRQIKLPMVSLVGPGEAHGADIASVLANGRIDQRDVEVLDATIAMLLDAVTTVHIEDVGECVVPLSLQDDVRA
ncbi:hypothetical protein FBU59_004158 [Linderina macrospora]|uniref:Uncharacterized protein n=1 Tax=Linderina macrospora TaxID=4868 RepID=A0ACC1J6K6_9FUNG|nr:hypothetical protein FBU59_004158 [Linderina macrospora]